MKIQLEHNARVYALDLAQTGKTNTVTLNGQTYTVEILRAGDGWLALRFSDSSVVDSASTLRFSDSSVVNSASSVVDSASNLRFSASSAVDSASSAVNSASTLRFSDSSAVNSVVISVDGPKRWVTVNGQTFVLTQATGAAKRGGPAHHAAGELTAPMPGLVRAVQVAEGQAVQKGQTLVILEAMKMEIKVTAPQAGKVKSLKVQTGQTVEKDELLVEVMSADF